MGNTASRPSGSWTIAELARKFADSPALRNIRSIVLEHLTRLCDETNGAELDETEIILGERKFWLTGTSVDGCWLAQEVNDEYDVLPNFVLIPTPQHRQFRQIVMNGLPFVAFTPDDTDGDFISQSAQRWLEVAALSALLQLID